MPWSAISSQSFIGNFSNVRTAHHHRNARQADRVGNPVRLLNHSCHCADADEIDLFFFYKLNDLIVAHRTRIGVNQNNLMTGRSERLQEKHPEVRHKVASDTIVWIIEQYLHLSSPGE